MRQISNTSISQASSTHLEEKGKIFLKMKKIQLYKKKYRSSVGAGDG
jgi:hypothetical protein